MIRARFWLFLIFLPIDYIRSQQQQNFIRWALQSYYLIKGKPADPKKGDILLHAEKIVGERENKLLRLEYRVARITLKNEDGESMTLLRTLYDPK